MSNLLERIYRNSGHPDAIQGNCANFFNSKKHILQITMQYIYSYIFFLLCKFLLKRFAKKRNTHLCWIWLSLVRPSVQAGRTGWDGSSPPLPPPSRRHSESRHKSLQRWCRHLEPRESINPVDEPEDAKAADVFFFSFLFFFFNLASYNNKAPLHYGDRRLEMFSYWLKFGARNGTKLTARWHLTFSISYSKHRKWNLWACLPVYKFMTKWSKIAPLPRPPPLHLKKYSAKPKMLQISVLLPEADKLGWTYNAAGHLLN